MVTSRLSPGLFACPGVSIAPVSPLHQVILFDTHSDIGSDVSTSRPGRSLDTCCPAGPPASLPAATVPRRTRSQCLLIQSDAVHVRLLIKRCRKLSPLYLVKTLVRRPATSPASLGLGCRVERSRFCFSQAVAHFHTHVGCGFVVPSIYISMFQRQQVCVPSQGRAHQAVRHHPLLLHMWQQVWSMDLSAVCCHHARQEQHLQLYSTPIQAKQLFARVAGRKEQINYQRVSLSWWSNFLME